jgi:hypothetical protein
MATGNGLIRHEKMNPQKPLNDAHEINFTAFQEKLAKQSFNGRILQEVDKVVKIKAQNERRC